MANPKNSSFLREFTCRIILKHQTNNCGLVVGSSM
jgi:hypothetical protein